MKNRIFLCLALALGCFAARPAAASEVYATQISSVMPCVAQCSLCHRDNTGGPGNLNLQFGVTMLTKGMLDREGRGDAVAALNLIGPTNDTDGDMVPDRKELEDGTNPSLAGTESVCGPQYGCGASIAQRTQPIQNNGAASGLAGLTALVLGALTLRRRTRAAKPAS